MILDEQDVGKLFKKVDCFETVGYMIVAKTASVAAAKTAGMAALSLATTAIGAGVSAYGQAQQGKTANVVAQRNALIQSRNATIAQQNAEFNAKLQERDARRRRSKNIASLGGSGIDVYEGTNLIALAEQEFVDDMNVQLTRRGGAIEASNLTQQAAITSAQGTASQRAGYLGAGTSLLTGAGKVGMQGVKFSQQNVFGEA